VAIGMLKGAWTAYAARRQEGSGVVWSGWHSWHTARAAEGFVRPPESRHAAGEWHHGMKNTSQPGPPASPGKPAAPERDAASVPKRSWGYGSATAKESEKRSGDTRRTSAMRMTKRGVACTAVA